MGKLRRPELPPGPLDDLFGELHALHARAGRPSMRDLAKGQGFSYTTVHELFTKTMIEPPRLPVLLRVVERLATLAPRVNVEESSTGSTRYGERPTTNPSLSRPESPPLRRSSTCSSPPPVKASHRCASGWSFFSAEVIQSCCIAPLPTFEITVTWFFMNGLWLLRTAVGY